MGQIIKVNLNVDAIDGNRLFKGKKGRYIDLSIFVRDEVDQYGNQGFVTQNATKQEREQGVKMPIIGNIKVYNQANTPPPSATPLVLNTKPTAIKPESVSVNNPKPNTISDDELPF